MDSLTQAVLGAGVAAVCAPKEHRRKALLIGAALGTLPDLDVFIDYGDAVANFTYHRGFSHSLFVLAPLAVLLWWLLKQFWQPVRLQQQRWFYAIFLALITHPLLDAHTAYGTQLFWPLQSPPLTWSTLFIIDPLFTLPLVVGVLLIVIRPDGKTTHKILAMSLSISIVYLGWSWWAKNTIEDKVIRFYGSEKNDLVLFSTPTPFNTLFWRAVVMKEEHYSELYVPVFGDAKPRVNEYPNNRDLIENNRSLWSVARLYWFAQGFVKAERIDNQLVIADLRMGVEPHYVFRHVVAEMGNPHWKPVAAERLPETFNRQDVINLLKSLSGFDRFGQREPHLIGEDKALWD